MSRFYQFGCIFVPALSISLCNIVEVGSAKKKTHQRTRNQDKAALLFYFASLSLLSYRFGFSHFKFTRICAIPSLHFISLHIKCSSIQHPLHLYSFHHKICGCLSLSVYFHDIFLFIWLYHFWVFWFRQNVHGSSPNAEQKSICNAKKIYDIWNIILFCHLHILNLASTIPCLSNIASPINTVHELWSHLYDSENFYFDIHIYYLFPSLEMEMAISKWNECVQ